MLSLIFCRVFNPFYIIVINFNIWFQELQIRNGIIIIIVVIVFFTQAYLHSWLQQTADVISVRQDAALVQQLTRVKGTARTVVLVIFVNYALIQHL